MLNQITARKMNEIIESMRTMFEPIILEQGWQYFHRGRIRKVAFSQKEVLAEITATSTFHVRLNLASFPSSKCSCEYSKFCKHIASVCFHIYTAFGRPELLLQDLKQYAMQRKKRSAQLHAKAQRSAVQTKVAELGNSPSSWQKYFEQQFYGYAVANQHAVEDFYSIVLERWEQLSTDWEESDKQYLLLHVLLFVLGKCNQFYTHNDTAYMSYYLEIGIRNVVEQVMNKLESVVADITVLHKSSTPALWMNETTELIGNMICRTGRQLTEILDVYRLLWFELLNDPLRIHREMARIREECDSYSTDSDDFSQKICILALFDVMAGEDDSAFERLKHSKQDALEPYFWYLRRFHNNQQWSRLHHWLRQLVPHMMRGNQTQFRQICVFWAELSSRQSTDEEWVQVMADLLPRSYSFYSDYLLQTGRYKQWVDLQLSHRMLPAHLYNEDLKKVEQHNMELLLPLYHQTAERYIMEKNRSSYMNAVRILRKLRNCYYTLNQSERWNEFIYQYAEKYNRLKAFHEELRKGKLIP